MTESLDVMRKRLHMRSIRRGIKEMDLILTAFSERHLAELSEADLTTYDALLSENDHDLYQWVSGATAAPDVYQDLIATMTKDAVGLTKP